MPIAIDNESYDVLALSCTAHLSGVGTIISNLVNKTWDLYRQTLFVHRATARNGLGPPHYRGFTNTLRHIAIGRTPLDKGSARRRDLYLTTHTTHKRQTPIPPAGFELTIPASGGPQTQALDHAAIAIGHELNNEVNNTMEQRPYPKANTSSARQKTARILWARNVHYHVHNDSNLFPILSQINPVHALPFLFL
jgi:hypothetical protein